MEVGLLRAALCRHPAVVPLYLHHHHRHRHRHQLLLAQLRPRQVQQPHRAGLPPYHPVLRRHHPSLVQQVSMLLSVQTRCAKIADLCEGISAALPPSSYVSLPWFPASKLKHLELYLIIAGSLTSISMELVIGPEKHQPFDNDVTIPSNHLHNFEHAAISLALLIYAAFAVVFDRVKAQLRDEMTMLLGAAAFTQ
ncbi:hypothetical protein Cni_G16037 [Canna indica]|uniref:Uncharacterized protein n=1 Tax=Canna indica TaxID=4628 RepID=A0AAQ3KFK9_9LILI|nr:hypothetical protein Cni_G16037 [Canna indica]